MEGDEILQAWHFVNKTIYTLYLTSTKERNKVYH